MNQTTDIGPKEGSKDLCIRIWVAIREWSGLCGRPTCGQTWDSNTLADAGVMVEGSRILRLMVRLSACLESSLYFTHPLHELT